MNKLFIKIIDIFKDKRKSDIELNDNDFDKITGYILEKKSKRP